jgi:hypothetical protein
LAGKIVAGCWESLKKKQDFEKTRKSAPVCISSKTQGVILIIRLHVVDFPLGEVRPLQLDVVDHGVRRTRGAVVRKLQGVGNSTFSSFLRKKIKKIERKKLLCAPTPPEDQVICLFAGLLSNPGSSRHLTYRGGDLPDTVSSVKSSVVDHLSPDI